MPDITMCKAEECPLKEKCYRYIAKPSTYQSYFVGFPGKGEHCTYYWPVDEQRSKTKK